MTNNIFSFKDIPKELILNAGGKGGMLSNMYQSGYPVPDGFVVLPDAFQNEVLNSDALNEIKNKLKNLRDKYKDAKFAVRSSALSEDSASASFAGEFETVLNVETDKEIESAIYAVLQSKESERVKSYSTVHNIIKSHKIAVVVQLMVQSEISGVLFTADPITGSFSNMVGNYVHGLGEQLVSGEADAFEFKVKRPKGVYEGPGEFKKYASKLFDLAKKLEEEFGGPQDIEWAIRDNNIFILQSRPVTTLSMGNLNTYDINYSHMGDELWINTNIAEAIPDVFSPFNWSIERRLDEALDFIPGYYVLSGNIWGRPYMNISRRVSVISTMLGKDAKSSLKMLGDFYGDIPEGMEMPLYPFSRLEVIRTVLPKLMKAGISSVKDLKNLNEFLNLTPEWCKNIRMKIKKINSKEELLILWKNEIQPYVKKSWSMAGAGAMKITNVSNLSSKLIEMVGGEDANTLLSNLRGKTGLESLGPVAGISKVISNEMTIEQYLDNYGHRSAHEYELSFPDPAEDEDWLSKQIEEFNDLNIDVKELLNKQNNQYEEAKKRFSDKFPDKTKWLENKLQKAAEGAQLREKARSEFVRAFRVVRSFALKAGEILELHNDIFFLYIDEIEEMLAGGKSKADFIPDRKSNYEKYKSMPPFPSVINGRFDPEEWAKNPERTMDYYDANMKYEINEDSDILKGCAGASGRIEGTVRVLSNIEEGINLIKGEILVAATTNIGWTPLFPKAAAIVTDIGAPLSHAAIVARELGIPAVVGCGNATLKLKTGDQVIVDGGRGIVEII